jgi:hypothetical protein
MTKVPAFSPVSRSFVVRLLLARHCALHSGFVLQHNFDRVDDKYRIRSVLNLVAPLEEPESP